MSFPNGGELLVLLVLVLVVVGPERLPRYAQQLADLVRGGVRYAKGARESLKEEMGPEFDDIDWKKLDPRQYDPRRIVRDALTDVWDEPVKPKSPGGPSAAAPSRPAAGAEAAGPVPAQAPAAGPALGAAAGVPAARAPSSSRTRAARPGSSRGRRSPGAPTPYDTEAT